MAYGGRATGGGEGELSNPILNIPIPRDVEDFSITFQ